MPYDTKLRSKLTPALLILGGILLLQGVAVRFLPSGEKSPAIIPFATFPSELGSWVTSSVGTLEPEILDVLRSDDYMIRTYQQSKGSVPVDLLIAYYRERNVDQGPHSPQTCFPGAGWRSLGHRQVSIAGAKGAKAGQANLYTVGIRNEKRVVVYWYQTGDRTIDSEFSARIHSVRDMIFRNRSDTSLVRIVVPVRNNDTGEAENVALEFASALYLKLSDWLSAT